MYSCFPDHILYDYIYVYTWNAYSSFTIFQYVLVEALIFPSLQKWCMTKKLDWLYYAHYIAFYQCYDFSLGSQW